MDFATRIPDQDKNSKIRKKTTPPVARLPRGIWTKNISYNIGAIDHRRDEKFGCLLTFVRLFFLTGSKSFCKELV